MNYVISFGVGLAFGAAYALLGVRSPAPPVIALVGLAGMLCGEQLVPLVKQSLTPHRVVSNLRVIDRAHPEFRE